MSALLFLPGLCVVLFRALGTVQTLVSLAIIAGVQVILGAPFLLADWRAYVSSAFDFLRVFLYKWTVNWRFLDEATFLDAGTARVLLGAHAALLAAFGLFRWTGIGTEGVSWQAHLFGAIGGVVAGMVITSDDPPQLVAKRQAKELEKARRQG